MDEIREKKVGIRNDMVKMIEGYSDSEREAKTKQIEDRLFDFANFIESRIPLLYVDLPTEVPTEKIIRRCFTQNKIVILPVFDKDKKTYLDFFPDFITNKETCLQSCFEFTTIIGSLVQELDEHNTKFYTEEKERIAKERAEKLQAKKANRKPQAKQASA